MEIRPVGTELFHAKGWTDEQIWLMKLITGFGTSDILKSHKYFLLFYRWINRRDQENAGSKCTGSQRLHDTSLTVHEGEGSWRWTHHSY